MLSSDGEVEFDSGAEVDLAGPVKVKRAVSKGGSVARVRGELRVADGYEEEETAMSEGGEDAAVLGVGGKYAGVQAAGGAVSVEKGVELTSVRAADGGQVRAFGGHTLKLGRGRSEFKGVNGSAGGDVEVAGVSGEGAERVQREAAALRALNGSEASKASMVVRAKEVHGEEHVGGDADVDELVGLLAEYSELEAALEQGGVVKRVDGGRRLLSDVESDVDGALRGMNVSLYDGLSVVDRMRGVRDLRLARRAVCSGVVCSAKPGVCRAGEEGKGCCPCRRADADEARCARVRCRAERVCRGGENASACCPCARMPSRDEVYAAVARMNGSSWCACCEVLTLMRATPAVLLLLLRSVLLLLRVMRVMRGRPC